MLITDSLDLFALAYEYRLYDAFLICFIDSIKGVLVMSAAENDSFLNRIGLYECGQFFEIP